jgi:methylglutaconyl-CoA hydratase
MLRGSGKHFCAGADVGGPGGSAQGGGRQYSMHDVLALLDAQPQPTLAVVQGAAVGGGAGFVSCCDVVLAADAAFFSIPEVRIGMPPVRLARYLIRAMGYRAFRRYGLSGERISANEALRTGLAHEVCPADGLDARAAEIVDALLHGAPGALRELKQAIAGMAMPDIPPLADDARAAHDPMQSPEAKEGIASFREKRKPKWYPAPE